MILHQLSRITCINFMKFGKSLYKYTTTPAFVSLGQLECGGRSAVHRRNLDLSVYQQTVQIASQHLERSAVQQPKRFVHALAMQDWQVIYCTFLTYLLTLAMLSHNHLLPYFTGTFHVQGIGC